MVNVHVNVAVLVNVSGLALEAVSAYLPVALVVVLVVLTTARFIFGKPWSTTVKAAPTARSIVLPSGFTAQVPR